jgi:hypothetical protein
MESCIAADFNLRKEGIIDACEGRGIDRNLLVGWVVPGMPQWPCRGIDRVDLATALRSNKISNLSIKGPVKVVQRINHFNDTSTSEENCRYHICRKCKRQLEALRANPAK